MPIAYAMPADYSPESAGTAAVKNLLTKCVRVRIPGTILVAAAVVEAAKVSDIKRSQSRKYGGLLVELNLILVSLKRWRVICLQSSRPINVPQRSSKKKCA